VETADAIIHASIVL